MSNDLKFFLYKFGKAMLSTIFVSLFWMALEFFIYKEVRENYIDNIIILLILWLFYKCYYLEELTIYKNEVIILNSNLCRNIERLKIKFNNKFYNIVVFYSPTNSIEEFHFDSKNKPDWKSQIKIIKALERRSKS